MRFKSRLVDPSRGEGSAGGTKAAEDGKRLLACGVERYFAVRTRERPGKGWEAGMSEARQGGVILAALTSRSWVIWPKPKQKWRSLIQ